MTDNNNICSREYVINSIIKTDRIDINDNCHRSNKYYLNYMKKLLNLNLYKLQISINSPVISCDKFNPDTDLYDFRVFNDDNSGEFISKNYNGHTTVCYFDSDTDEIYVFDTILLPYNIGIRGMNLDNYINIVTRTFSTSNPSIFYCRVIPQLYIDKDITFVKYSNKSITTDLEENNDSIMIIKKLPFNSSWFKYKFN